LAIDPLATSGPRITGIPPAVLDDVPAEPTSTWGGGSDFAVIYWVGATAKMASLMIATTGGTIVAIAVAMATHLSVAC
jgi:hypothetical protein